MPQVGDYELLRELGRGANGVVFAAKKVGLERVVALKVLLATDLDHEALGRFQIEARVASRLTDPGVVTVIDMNRDAQGRPYYVMEFCPGPTLQKRLKTQGPYSIAEALELCAELARIMAFAHSKGVIHRDLKPANIILEEGSGRPRVTDFGLARDTRLSSSLTRSGDLIGTPLYMSPEQLRGTRAIDHRVDVYALGAILYECLTGRLPHVATSVAALALKVGQEPVPAPSTHRREIPGDVDGICLKALASDPLDRQATCEQLREEILVARKLLDLRAARKATRDRSALRWLLPLAGASVLLPAAAFLARSTLRTPPPPVASSPSPAAAAPTPSPTPTPAPSPSPVVRIPEPGAPADQLEAALRADLDDLFEHGVPTNNGRTRPPEGASVLVFDPRSRRTVYSRDAGVPRRAATTVQLLTCAAALERFPTLELTTRLLVPPRKGLSMGGVLEGDLALLGGGDPLVGPEQLGIWAAALGEWGLAEVSGDLVVDARRFDGNLVNEGWGRDVTTTYKGARVSALGFNLGSLDVSEAAGGFEAKLEERRFPVRFAADVPTGLVDLGPDGWTVTIDHEWFARAGGNSSAPVSRPDRFLGDMLRERLEEAGIKVRGKVREARPDERLETWDQVPRPQCTHVAPLDELVKHVGRRSQPWIAECLFRALSAEATGLGTWEGSRKLVTEHAVKGCGASPEEVQIQDGSGNAPGTRLSARAVVSVLDRAPEKLASSLNRFPIALNVFRRDKGSYRLGWYTAPQFERAINQRGVVFAVQADSHPDAVVMAGYLADSVPGKDEIGPRRLAFAVLLAPPLDAVALRQLDPGAPPDSRRPVADRAQEEARAAIFVFMDRLSDYFARRR